MLAEIKSENEARKAQEAKEEQLKMKYQMWGKG